MVQYRSMKIIITGGSGFIGEALSRALLNEGHQVVVMDLRYPKFRHKNLKFVFSDIANKINRDKNLKNPDIVINLAGRPIFARWNSKVKKSIYNSRVLGTSNLVDLWQEESFRPKALFSASAVGYYGNRFNENLIETSTLGSTFLAKVAKDWEASALRAEKKGVKVFLIRQGHVLDSSGGMLGVLLPFYKLGIGGPLGSGRQFFPWISLSDLVSLYVKLCFYTGQGAVINAVSPDMVTNRSFSYTLAQALNRPHLFNIPKWLLKVVFGELAFEITASQKVYPAWLVKEGFEYKNRSLVEFLHKTF